MFTFSEYEVTKFVFSHILLCSLRHLVKVQAPVSDVEVARNVVQVIPGTLDLVRTLSKIRHLQEQSFFSWNMILYPNPLIEWFKNNMKVLGKEPGTGFWQAYQVFQRFRLNIDNSSKITICGPLLKWATFIGLLGH